MMPSKLGSGPAKAARLAWAAPGWWIPITGAADILALAILLSPPIRHWVAKKPVPVR